MCLTCRAAFYFNIIKIPIPIRTAESKKVLQGTTSPRSIPTPSKKMINPTILRQQIIPAPPVFNICGKVSKITIAKVDKMM